MSSTLISCSGLSARSRASASRSTCGSVGLRPRRVCSIAGFAGTLRTLARGASATAGMPALAGGRLHRGYDALEPALDAARQVHVQPLRHAGGQRRDDDLRVARLALELTRDRLHRIRIADL